MLRIRQTGQLAALELLDCNKGNNVQFLVLDNGTLADSVWHVWKDFLYLIGNSAYCQVGTNFKRLTSIICLPVLFLGIPLVDYVLALKNNNAYTSRAYYYVCFMMVETSTYQDVFCINSIAVISQIKSELIIITPCCIDFFLQCCEQKYHCNPLWL